MEPLDASWTLDGKAVVSFGPHNYLVTDADEACRIAELGRAIGDEDRLRGIYNWFLHNWPEQETFIPAQAVIRALGACIQADYEAREADRADDLDHAHADHP